MEIKEVDDKIIITKVKKEKISLEDIISAYEGNDLSKEFEWDEA